MEHPPFNLKWRMVSPKIPVSRTMALLLGLVLAGACSTGPQPPIFIDMPQTLTFSPATNKNTEPVPVAVLPVVFRGDAHNAGLLFHTTGGTSRLLVEHSLTETVRKSLEASLKSEGFKPYDASTKHHALVVRMEILTFEDRVRANLLHVRHKATLKCRYVIIRQNGEKSIRVVKTSEREHSPTPSAVFDSKVPAKLLDSLLKESLEKDLIPALERLVREES